MADLIAICYPDEAKEGEQELQEALHGKSAD
jgi:hypothetical protein